MEHRKTRVWKAPGLAEEEDHLHHIQGLLIDPTDRELTPFAAAYVFIGHLGPPNGPRLQIRGCPCRSEIENDHEVLAGLHLSAEDNVLACLPF